jgi:hypothetical protein
MLIYNTEFGRILAAEIKIRKDLCYIKEKLKNPAKQFFQINTLWYWMHVDIKYGDL